MKEANKTPAGGLVGLDKDALDDAFEIAENTGWWNGYSKLDFVNEYARRSDAADSESQSPRLPKVSQEQRLGLSAADRKRIRDEQRMVDGSYGMRRPGGPNQMGSRLRRSKQ